MKNEKVRQPKKEANEKSNKDDQDASDDDFDFNPDDFITLDEVGDDEDQDEPQDESQEVLTEGTTFFCKTLNLRNNFFKSEVF